MSSPTSYGFPTATSPFTASNSGSSYDYNDETPLEASRAYQRRPELQDQRPTKKHRYESSDEESRSSVSTPDSGESEREEEADDADDDEYQPDTKAYSRSGSRRRTSTRQANTRSFSPLDSTKPRLAPPVPVPNLTKKSRGRRVPTTAVVVSQNGVEKVCPCLAFLYHVLMGVAMQNIRGYKCKVPGCNKHFQRGEHLKRHVRSIHTNDKRLSLIALAIRLA